MDESRCPFCGVAVDAGEIAAPPLLSGRVGRVAAVAVGAGLLLSLSGCPAYGGPEDFDAGEPRDSGPGVVDDAGDDAGETDAG